MQAALLASAVVPGAEAAQHTRRGALKTAAATLIMLTGLAQPVGAETAAAGEEAVRAAVQTALRSTVPASKAPAVLRLAFHDAGTYSVSSRDGGANGSLVYELDRPEDAQKLLRGTAAEGLSLADLIQVAGAHAVAITGGPSIRVPLGRLDAAVADPVGRMPEETLDGTAMREHFASSGFSARELVALAGAHTIGGKGFGEPLRFDNSYFKTLLAAPWGDPRSPAAEQSHIGLASDRLLTLDPECKKWVEAYAADEALWFADFAEAYVKMGRSGARFAS